ncbi:unnamed protein product [Polarella glacialis]|uniref:Uncharacterized protein n=1 Tax=Polarella glacialis TaxID=89957 RepID=A0A813EI86_POLGL|nr:unnamed protein product [Polarella glacialis]CAE8646491.1 unnamed protein product [Polarella glacialis]
MPGRVHSNINWDCPRADTWASSGLKRLGIEQRQIIRDLQSPQMPSAAGSNKSSGTAGACLTNEVVCTCPVSQQLCTAARQRAMKPLALRNDCLAWAGRLLAWQFHGQAAREH